MEQEGIAVDPTVLPLVVRAAAGSARDGLSILDQVLASAGAEGVTRESAAELLGVTPDSLLDDVLDAFAARDGAAVFASVDRVMENGHDPRRFAADVLERLRDLVILDAVPDAEDKGLLDCPPEQLVTMRPAGAALGTAGLSRAADLFHAGLVEMRGTTSPRLLLELLCARVLLPAAASDEGAVLARLERLERRFDISGAARGDRGCAPAPVAAPVAVPAARPCAPRPRSPRTGRRHRACPARPLPAPVVQAWPEAAVPGGSRDARSRARQPAGRTAQRGRRPRHPRGAPGVGRGHGHGQGPQAHTWVALMDASVQAVDAKTLTLSFSRVGNQKNFAGGANADYLNDALRVGARTAVRDRQPGRRGTRRRRRRPLPLRAAPAPAVADVRRTGAGRRDGAGGPRPAGGRARRRPGEGGAVPAGRRARRHRHRRGADRPDVEPGPPGDPGADDRGEHHADPRGHRERPGRVVDGGAERGVGERARQRPEGRAQGQVAARDPEGAEGVGERRVRQPGREPLHEHRAEPLVLDHPRDGRRRGPRTSTAPV